MSGCGESEAEARNGAGVFHVDRNRFEEAKAEFDEALRLDPVEFVVADTSGFTHTFTVATSKAKEKILKDVPIRGNETKSIIVAFPKEVGKLYLFCRPHEAVGMIGTIEVGT